MARQFDDAASEYLGNASTPVLGVPLTLVGWFNSDDNTASGTLVSVCADAGSEYFQLVAAGAVAGDPVRITCRNDVTTEQADTTTTFLQGVWHHAAGVFTSSTSRDVYLDAGGKGSNTNAATPVGLDRIGIGVVNRGTPFVFMSGLLAELAIYNTWLTIGEIGLLYYHRYSPLKVRPQNLVAYYALRHGDNWDWLGRYPLLPHNTPSDGASPPIVYPERDDPVWGLVLPRYRPRRYWVVLKAPAGNPWYAYAQM